MELYITSVSAFLKLHPEVDESHGLGHYLAVVAHAEKAITAHRLVPHRHRLLVLLASLLHDVDDEKYFKTENYANARSILEVSRSCDSLTDDEIELIIKMISWVSSSKNGDNIPEECLGQEWLLYPRYADRLEALGIIGVERTLEYTLKKNRPLYTEETLRATSEQELWTQVATSERYHSYSGKSASMIDHLYDKLLRLGKYPIRNTYFDSECEKRQKPLVDMALLFGATGFVTEELVRDFCEANK